MTTENYELFIMPGCPFCHRVLDYMGEHLRYRRLSRRAPLIGRLRARLDGLGIGELGDAPRHPVEGAGR